MPTRLQLRRTKGYRKPAGAVVVRRRTPWGNPYPLKVYGRTEALRRALITAPATPFYWCAMKEPLTD